MSFHMYSDIGDPKEDKKFLITSRASKSPFEIKAASELPKYNGREKLPGWRKKVGNYLLSRCCDMDQLLKWAEQQDEQITNEVLKVASKMMNGLVHDACAVSYHLWGWLSFNLTDDAEEVFESAVKGDGIEVWRLLTADMMKKTTADKLSLENVVTPRA